VTVAASASARRERSSLADRLVPIGVGLVVAPVLTANGGYSATTWGWTAAALAGACFVTVAVGAVTRPSRLELLFVGSLLAFTFWEALSLAWSEAPSQTPLEVERTLVYVTGALAASLLVRRRRMGELLGGVLAGLAIVCAYALATRLFPDQFTQHAFGRGRLSTPVGYWNGLGITASMTVLLGLGIAARQSKYGRMLGAGALPVAVCTLYFTFSRGAWLALGLGLVVLLTAERRRLNFLAAIAAPSGLAIVALFFAVRGVGGAKVAEAGSGHFVAAVVAIAAAAAAYSTIPFRRLERSVKVGRRTRRATSLILVGVLVVALAGVFVRFGSPVKIARHAYDSLVSTPPATGGDLNKRLFSLSSNGRLPLWRVAVHEFEAHPVAGGGPGSYEQEWLRHRTISAKVRDAHSLYLETLAETGVVGMALLGLALLAPLLALRRARREPLATAALAAYVAFLIHAVADWDWELSGLTLAAILCGSALLVASRPDQQPAARRWQAAPIAALLLVAALWGLAGNLAISASERAVAQGNFSASASEARRARLLQPWSAQPLQLLGNAQLALGNRAAATATLKTAVSKSSGDWTIWLDLARAATGKERARALANAQRLDPLEKSIVQFGRALNENRQ
jgi:hypothetical protein